MTAPSSITVVPAVIERSGKYLVCRRPPSKRHTDRIDSALTDIGLPDMNGVELASMIHNLIPELPVVYMSGRTDQEVLEEVACQESAGYIEKPFTVDDLLQTVHATLARQGGERELRAWAGGDPWGAAMGGGL